MKNLSRIIKLLFLCSVLSVQVFVYAGTTQAAVIPDPLKTDTKQQELPKYDGGVDVSIGDYLCIPTGDGTDLYNCIGKLYRFGVAAGAIALVFFIVIAGYFYITGGEQGKGKAKGVLLNAATGMGILLFSYVLLRFINPSLVEIKPIQPPIFSSVDLPSCEEIGFGSDCIISTGPNKGQVFNGGAGEKGQCTVANLSKCSKWNANEAVAVCGIESRGYSQAQSGTDLCDNLKGPNGGYLSFSYGIMQVSLKSMGSTFPECAGILDYPEGAALRQGGNCPGGFKTAQNGTSYCTRRKCTAPKGIEAIHRCVNILYDVAKNVEASCTLYGKSCWAPWPDTGKIVSNYKKCPR